MSTKRTGATFDRSCPYCNDDETTDVARHIRAECPAVVEWRRSVGLPDEGYGALVVSDDV